MRKLSLQSRLRQHKIERQKEEDSKASVLELIHIVQKLKIARSKNVKYHNLRLLKQRSKD